MLTLSAPAAPAPTRDDEDTRWAWACLAAAPFLFALAVAIPIAASTTIYTTTGYPDTAPPDWTMWLLIGASLLIYLLPAGASRWFSLRAERVGDDRAQVPALLTLLLTLVPPGLACLFFFLILTSGQPFISE